ncbi:3-keto-steroid reductase/17-beta-hydroxysteroid dehydrogenase 7-like [Ylistrum balloti]|uniref:3-keto-steroid reductase/17-beta-hydroxysteroid dehydrogenase 7-like n=1 Tax=Ylistrum balloti TaxID=509963 RepID=UPI002905D7B3|nr:3-keto-steroid reductase/17-beta-hydroxysteroid dehydrogenase 7-like [Ylistrum balloti]
MGDGTKVAVVTGANGGIGLTLAERLLTIHKDLHLCLACRNRQRAQTARDVLLLSHPKAQISIITLDTSNVQSVLSAVKDIKKQFPRIDYLYLNAGKMSVKSLDFSNLLKSILKMNTLFLFNTGHGLLVHTDEHTSEGLMSTFATNAFGHFVLVKELEDILGGNQPSQVIWTSSVAGVRSAFDPRDLQAKNGKDPYGSTKCVIDTTSMALNEKVNSKNIYSHTTCPGLVLTNMTDGILASWIWWLILPFMYIFRLVLDHLSIDTYKGSESLVWLSQQNPESLKTGVRYHSTTDIWGNTTVQPVQINFSLEESLKVYEEMNSLYKGFKEKYKS